MKTKTKGTKAERELIHMFWNNGFAAIRSAGSGSMKFPSPDIIASCNKKIFAIECKSLKGRTKYIEKGKIEELISFSKLFNVIPLIAVRFDRNGWFFLKPEEIIKTEKNYIISLDNIIKKAKRFRDIFNKP